MKILVAADASKVGAAAEAIAYAAKKDDYGLLCPAQTALAR